MNDVLKSWWRTRTLREQRLLLVMFGLAAVVLTWLLVIRPLSDALSRAKERHGQAVLALAEARAQAAAIGGMERAPRARLTVPIEVLLNQAATEAGFPVAKVEREGTSQATMTLQSVRPQAFFAWTNQMEGRSLLVERLSATANSDQTLSVTVTFRARGG
jgi:general secretion pathway protein M